MAELRRKGLKLAWNLKISIIRWVCLDFGGPWKKAHIASLESALPGLNRRQDVEGGKHWDVSTTSVRRQNTGQMCRLSRVRAQVSLRSSGNSWGTYYMVVRACQRPVVPTTWENGDQDFRRLGVPPTPGPWVLCLFRLCVLCSSSFSSQCLARCVAHTGTPSMFAAWAACWVLVCSSSGGLHWAGVFPGPVPASEEHGEHCPQLSLWGLSVWVP